MDLDYQAIGERIRNARLQVNMTQESLAEKTNLSIQHISNIENGHTKRSLPARVSIAITLSVSIDFLLIDNLILTKEISSQEVQTTLSDCNDYETQIILDTIKALKNSLRKQKKS